MARTGRRDGAAVTPYYQEADVTIYHGDCREVLPDLDVADLVLTDPPYGIGKIWQGGFGRGWARARAQGEARNEWDAAPPDDDLVKLMLSRGRDVVIWGGNYFNLCPSRGWLVWNKPERNFSLAEAELAWTTRDAVVRVCDAPRSEPDRLHPTQKPLTLMRWCIEFFPHANTVLDPFMGSGTTLRAAKDAGRKATGIEMDERWCEVAAQRLSQEVLALEPASVPYTSVASLHGALSEPSDLPLWGTV